jgi:predicted Zn-dependent protease
MDNERIKKYLAGELAAAERNAFEQEMENDPFLMESIEGWSTNEPPATMEQLNALEGDLYASIDARVKEQPKKGKIIHLSFFRYAVAASVIGILALLSWRLFITPNAVSGQEIYASYFKPLTHPDATVRGENDTTTEAQAVAAYEREDYFEAVKHYEKLVANNPDNVKNNLFLGISFLGSNQPKKAIDILSKITASEEFHFDIQWYLALAYIKSKDISQAQTTLTNLTKEENYYQTEAKEILDKLDGKVALK